MKKLNKIFVPFHPLYIIFIHKTHDYTYKKNNKIKKYLNRHK